MNNIVESAVMLAGAYGALVGRAAAATLSNAGTAPSDPDPYSYVLIGMMVCFGLISMAWPWIIVRVDAVFAPLMARHPGIEYIVVLAIIAVMFFVVVGPAIFRTSEAIEKVAERVERSGAETIAFRVLAANTDSSN